MAGAPKLADHGEIGGGHTRPDVIRSVSHGTSADYLAARIKRDHPDIAEKPLLLDFRAGGFGHPNPSAAQSLLRWPEKPWGQSLALPHFWWKGISPRAVIPLEANAVLGSPASCCQFAIGAARKIDKGAALQDVAAPRWP